MKACRNCRFLFDHKDAKWLTEAEIEKKEKVKNRCPNCNSTDLSDDYSGMILVIDPESSEIAKRMSVTKPGQYALRVR